MGTLDVKILIQKAFMASNVIRMTLKSIPKEYCDNISLMTDFFLMEAE